MNRHFKEMGIFRAMTTLLHMNQKEGFDCPSCAWPDPEKPSKIQGSAVKTVLEPLADEATTAHLGAATHLENTL